VTWNLWVALVLIVSWVAVHRITRDTPREKRALLQVEHDLEREEAQRLDAARCRTDSAFRRPQQNCDRHVLRQLRIFGSAAKG
jgi:hypothetical protein